MRCTPFVVLSALAACGPGSTTDMDVAPADGSNDGSNDGADDSPPRDSGISTTPLRYMPAGCRHMLSTAPATRNNRMGDATTFGPMPEPRNVHVTWPTNDPATTIAALWATDAGTLATTMRYGTDRAALAMTATGHVSTGGLAGNEVTMHEVHVCGLRPATTYYYQVGGEGHWSEVQSFVTAPAPGGTGYDVTFSVAGDSRDDVGVWRAVQERMHSVAAMRVPDFEVFTGDAVLIGLIQSQWDAWFTNGRMSMARMPFLMAHGNHEALSVNYLMQFAQPQVGMAVQDELFFSVDYGPIHFIMLNDSTGSNAVITGVERDWLVADLRAVDRARTPWVIAVHHKGAFSSSTHTSDSDTQLIRATWPAVFATGGVDLVLNGHDHDFEITQPLGGDGAPVTSGRGTVYVTAAGAGARLYGARMSPWTRYSESVVNFALVHVTERALDLTPYRGDGTVIDQGRLSLTRP